MTWTINEDTNLHRNIFSESLHVSPYTEIALRHENMFLGELKIIDFS